VEKNGHAFCQFVSKKNRIERVIFCNMCKLNEENFDYSIFIDECTVSMEKTAIYNGIEVVNLLELLLEFETITNLDRTV